MKNTAGGGLTAEGKAAAKAVGELVVASWVAHVGVESGRGEILR